MIKTLQNYSSPGTTGQISTKLDMKHHNTEVDQLEAALNELQIVSFGETVFLHKAKTMYKIANNAAPIYLTDLFKLRSNESNVN